MILRGLIVMMMLAPACLAQSAPPPAAPDLAPFDAEVLRPLAKNLYRKVHRLEIRVGQLEAENLRLAEALAQCRAALADPGPDVSGGPPAAGPQEDPGAAFRDQMAARAKAWVADIRARHAPADPGPITIGDLPAEVAFDADQAPMRVTVTNRGDRDWAPVDLAVNARMFIHGHRCAVPALGAGESITLELRAFTDLDGQPFHPAWQPIETFTVRADGPEGVQQSRRLIWRIEATAASRR